MEQTIRQDNAATAEATATAAEAAAAGALAGADALAAAVAGTPSAAAAAVPPAAPAAGTGEDAAAAAAPSRPAGGPAYRAAKRALDVVFSACVIVVLLVPSLVLCAVICAKSPGASPLYSQVRVGRAGRDGRPREFRMWKFRSMCPNADEMLGGLQGRNEAAGPMFKMRDDPRVIPGVGRFIRKHSIDEFPQFINVLKGDMSMVGPRPPLPCEVVEYSERDMRRLSVKPGLTGPWQVGGRSDLGFEEMVQLDLAYIEGRTFAGDLRLILRTVKVVVTGEGAA